MRGEVTGNGNEDVLPRLHVAPFLKLPHSGLQHLIGVEIRILSQQGTCEGAHDQLRGMTQCDVTCHQARHRLDLVLAIESVEQSGADGIHARREIVEGIAFTRQPRRRHIQITNEINGKGAMKDRPQQLGAPAGELGIGHRCA